MPWVAWVARQHIGLREHWRDHLAVALVNNVLPFVCFAWAATVLPAGYLAVINGMVPLWTALIAVPVLKEPLGARRIAGFALGIAGVALHRQPRPGRARTGRPRSPRWSASPARRSGAGPAC